MLTGGIDDLAPSVNGPDSFRDRVKSRAHEEGRRYRPRIKRAPDRMGLSFFTAGSPECPRLMIVPAPNRTACGFNDPPEAEVLAIERISMTDNQRKFVGGSS